jgi:streptogrisin D
MVASALVIAGVLPGSASAEPGSVTGRTALTALDALPPTPNTAWGLDPTTGQLLLTVSDAAPAAGAARLLALADRFGRAVRTVRTHGPLTEQNRIEQNGTEQNGIEQNGIEHGRIEQSRTGQAVADPFPPFSPDTLSDGVVLGGDSINDGKIVCSAGFNVVQGDVHYLLTAGHCTAGLPVWSGIGPSVVSAFPNTDYGVIQDDSAVGPGAVDLFDGTSQQITAAGTATVDEQVCASGQTTHVTCGEVTAVDQTVDYGDGDVVHGLIETDVHTDHGDSGGSLFDGSVGLGMVSGGDGTTDFFQPLPPVLAAYGLDLAP